ncbi:MAG: Fibronectin type domain [Candidatus Parcubacteria bacterium]
MYPIVCYNASIVTRKTLTKTSLVLSIMALSMIQLQSVLIGQARGEAPLTAPLTGFVTITPTPTEAPFTAPVQSTPTPTATPTSAPSNNNSGGGSNNGGSNNNNGSNNGGGSSNNGGSNGGGNVCRDERPKSAPLLLSARATGANQVTLTWRKGWAPYTGFVISYSTKRGITQFTSEVGNTTVGTVSGLNANTTYFFKVQAKNGCVGGDFSRELGVRTYGKVAPKKTILGSKSKKAVVTNKKSLNTVVVKKTK